MPAAETGPPDSCWGRGKRSRGFGCTPPPTYLRNGIPCYFGFGSGNDPSILCCAEFMSFPRPDPDIVHLSIGCPKGSGGGLTCYLASEGWTLEAATAYCGD